MPSIVIVLAGFMVILWVGLLCRAMRTQKEAQYVSDTVLLELWRELKKAYESEADLCIKNRDLNGAVVLLNGAARCQETIQRICLRVSKRGRE